MTSSGGEARTSPARRAIFAGLVAGIAAGSVSYLLGTGIVGLVVGFVAGTLVGSRTVLLMARQRDEAE